MCNIAVAPLVGAWIEIKILRHKRFFPVVAPLVGAWIEIKRIFSPQQPLFVAPLVGAWIEITQLAASMSAVESLLSWERGLKFELAITLCRLRWSLLSWERGLKY